jgi:hypothetical protein
MRRVYLQLQSLVLSKLSVPHNSASAPIVLFVCEFDPRLFRGVSHFAMLSMAIVQGHDSASRKREQI